MPQMFMWFQGIDLNHDESEVDFRLLQLVQSYLVVVLWGHELNKAKNLNSFVNPEKLKLL